jgi:muramoyltetrapeptide carboxypeptidase
MIVPPYLQPGDIIGIVSTASRIEKEVVEPAIGLLTRLGFNVEVGKYTFTSFNQFSATDKQRASDLQAMLDDENIKAIVCSRGGYGTLRTLQLINWKNFLQHPKWIVGFSDVTVLHSTLTNFGIVSVHGVMPRYFLDNEKPSFSFETLLKALSGKQLWYELLPIINNRLGKAEGQLVGGNLSILYSLRGTPYDIDTRGKILFIEDLSEYMYHLDRMMMNLKVGGKLEQLAGMIVGNFTGMKDQDIPFGKTVEEIIFDLVTDYNFPVVFQFPAGHCKENFALKMGMNITLEVSENGSTIIQN